MGVYIKGLEMSKQDQVRLLQCIFCMKDPQICNCTEADEDENGMCLRYERRAEALTLIEPEK